MNIKKQQKKVKKNQVGVAVIESKNRIINALLIFIILLPFVYSISLPSGLQSAIDQTVANAQKISFFIAFIGGILTILSPCILPILPAYFACTFKEKKEITKTTLVFFLGFSTIFTIYGLIAGFLGEALSEISFNNNILIVIAGVVLVFFGFITITGKGFSFMHKGLKLRKGYHGIFLMGALFAIGWSPCVGPILSGILIVAASIGNYAKSALMLFIYSLGIFIPLFVFAFFYDKYNLSQNRFIRGKELSFGKYKINSTNLISGILLILVGFAFIIYRGTSFINSIDPFGTKQLFYSLQRTIIANSAINIVGLAVLAVFLYFLWKILRRRNF